MKTIEKISLLGNRKQTINSGLTRKCVNETGWNSVDHTNESFRSKVKNVPSCRTNCPNEKVNLIDLKPSQLLLHERAIKQIYKAHKNASC